MDHNSTTRRGGVSTKGDIKVNHICVCDGNEAVKSNRTNNADGYIVSSYFLMYWGRTNKITKEEILQHCVVCVKSKRGPK